MSYMCYLLGHQNICWGVAHAHVRKTCNFDKPLNHILKVMDGCMHMFCLVSIKTRIISMIIVNIKTGIISMMELQPSPFFTNLLHEAD